MMYDAALIKQILALVPAQHLPAFFALTTRDGVTKAEWQTTIPSLQRLGQMVARNPNLAPTFRAELIRLENAVQDIPPDEIRATIEHQLSERLRTYHPIFAQKSRVSILEKLS